jgi:hypothetical protein
MTELTNEIKDLTRRVKSKEVPFLLVLMEMTLRLSVTSVLSKDAYLSFESELELGNALVELAKELGIAFVNQQSGIKIAVERLLYDGVKEGKFDAVFFKSIAKVKK